MKAIVLMLLSVGVLACNENETHTYNESFYLRVQKECPKRCTEDKGVWSGLLRAYPDTIKCQCRDK